MLPEATDNAGRTRSNSDELVVDFHGCKGFFLREHPGLIVYSLCDILGWSHISPEVESDLLHLLALL